MKALVLAEKPSVGREIARILGCQQKQKHFLEGPRYVVSWAFGHLIELAEPEDYDPKYRHWKLEELPILPEKMELKVIKETAQQYKVLSQLAKRPDIGEVIIATDAGREGELVARWILKKLHWKKPVKRLWISSQTDQAIKEGFSKLRPGKDFEPLYQSAVCRAEADWLIGLNVTRALTCKYNAQLSAGRVQTPTLSMVIEHENQIRSFRPSPYWTLEANLGGFQAMWKSAFGDYRIWKEEEAEQVRQKANQTEGRIAGIKRKEKKEPHPLAYDLTELQRDTNRRYGFSARHTLNILQRLYERKLVTYPRTDSRYLSSDLSATLVDRLRAVAAGPFAALVQPLLQKPLPVSKRIVDDSRVTDHHAIIPTEEKVRFDELGNDEKKIYSLIAKRYISLFYPPFTYDLLQVEVKVGGETFLATGKTVKDPGWKEVYGMEADAEESSNGSGELPDQSLPSLQTGDVVSVKAVRLNKRFTEPPLRLTEAELLTRMEKNNLGTPATRADIIEKLLQTEALERQGNRLYPTQKGWQLIDLVAEELRSPELTAVWEQELERIARGKGDPQTFLANIREQTRKLVAQIAASQEEYKPHNVTGSKCPECGEFLREVKGKRGKSLVCPNRECNYRRSAETQLLNKRCPQCKKKMEFRIGKAGPYAHCKPCNVIEMLVSGRHGKPGRNKGEEKALLKKYSDKEGLTTSLGEALKAALQQKND